MKHIKLLYKNGAVKELFDDEVEKRVRAEYSEKREKEILRNMLVDTDTALSYMRRIVEIKTEVKAEIEAELGFAVDVGFDPDTANHGMADRVDSLETDTRELGEALTMILEGVTE